MLCSCIQVCQQETASVILRFNKMWAVYLADGKKTQNKDKANWDKTKLQLRLTMKTMTQEHEHESEQEHKKTQDRT